MKYFGIGISRTGTSTLAEAFKCLGYSTKHYLNNEQLNYFVQGLYNYDFINDMPVYWKYKELDEMFPGSKFVYTNRPIDSWKQSCINYFGTGRGLSDPQFLQYWQIFFKRVCNEVEYEQIYQEHQQEVFDYFKDRPDDLLVMNITEGDGWEKLCPFLDVTIPNDPFPYKNKLLTLIEK